RHSRDDGSRRILDHAGNGSRGHLSRNQMAGKNHTYQQDKRISRHVPLLSHRQAAFAAIESREVATSEGTGGTSPALPRLSRSFFFLALRVRSRHFRLTQQHDSFLKDDRNDESSNRKIGHATDVAPPRSLLDTARILPPHGADPEGLYALRDERRMNL